MKLISVIIISLFVVNISYSQSCFDAYDLMFTPENETLSYKEFHKLELNFLANLKGCDAVDFSISDINGNDLILSELKGKVIVLNFWFTTCMPCLREIPELNTLVEYNDADEVVFIGFARDSEDELSKFFSKYGDFNYHIVPNSYAIADKYRVVAWPQSMVINRDGKVYKSWAGLGKNISMLVPSIQKAIDDCLDYETATITKIK